MASCPLHASACMGLTSRRYVAWLRRIRSKRALMLLSRSSFSTNDSIVQNSEDDHEQRQQERRSLLEKASKVVDVTDLAQRMRASTQEYTQHFYKDQPVKLVGILAHDHDPFHADAEKYSQSISRNCQEDYIDYELCRIMGEEPAVVQEAIREANERPNVHGIIVYYPIFQQQPLCERGPYKNQLTGVYYKTQDDYLRDLVCPTRDVEGLCNEYNARWLFRARGTQRWEEEQVVFPCSALSVLRILESCRPNNQWSDTVVTIVNRSEIFGRPLAAMLANEGATVYSIDINTVLLFREGGRLTRCTARNVTLERCLQQSSVVVTGVPSPDFRIPIDSIRPGTTLVNVSEFANIDEERLLDIPHIQYVPHVGKVTVAALEQNLIQLHKRYHNTSS